MPLTLRPSVQTSRLYGQHAYSVLFVDIALVLTCIPIFFCGIVNIMQILRDDVTLLTHEGSEYRSSVLKCLATFLDTIPSSTTAFYALCSITCWTLFTLYPAIALCVDVALIGLWITIVILQIRGFDYFILENRYSLGWTTRPDADNWQGTYKLFRHNTNTVAVFQRLIIVGGFIVLLLLTYQAILNASILYGTTSGIRLPVEYSQIEYPNQSHQPRDEEVAHKVPVPNNGEPAPYPSSSTPATTLTLRLHNVRSFFRNRGLRSSRSAYTSHPATSTAVAHHRANEFEAQSIWTSIRAASSRLSLFTLSTFSPGTPYLPIHLSPRTSMEPPMYSPQARIDLPIDQPGASNENGGTEDILPVQSGDGERPSSPLTEDSLHFSDRVVRDGDEGVLGDVDELVLDDDAEDLPVEATGTFQERDTAATAADIDALVARITKEQEERFQQRLAEQARRFGLLLARAMMTSDAGGATEAPARV